MPERHLRRKIVGIFLASSFGGVALASLIAAIAAGDYIDVIFFSIFTMSSLAMAFIVIPFGILLIVLFPRFVVRRPIICSIILILPLFTFMLQIYLQAGDFKIPNPRDWESAVFYIPALSALFAIPVFSTIVGRMDIGG